MIEPGVVHPEGMFYEDTVLVIDKHVIYNGNDV